MGASEEEGDKELLNLIEKEKEKGICIHKYKCGLVDFSKLGRVEDIGLNGYLNTYCHPLECKYAVTFGKGYLCSCPVRIYIARKYKK
jgi:hypothetical protein